MKSEARIELGRFLQTSTPPELGPGPRPDVQPEARLLRDLDSVLARAGVPARQQQLIRALILLWHDHLDSAHTIAQDIDNADGAFVHGIMHRREPDFGNARYWFRRVGDHPAFAELAGRVGTMMESGKSAGSIEPLVRDGRWDSFGFIDACERASGRGGDEVRALRDVQRIESEVLLQYFTAA